MDMTMRLDDPAPLLDLMHKIAAPMFCVRRNPDDSFTFVSSNEAQARLAGFAPGSLDGADPFALLPTRLARSICAKYRACLASGQPSRYEQGFSLRGQERWWHVTLTPLVAPDGGAARFLVGCVADITEIKNRLFAAHARTALLERQYEDLKVLTSVTAQDMRAPLGNVRSLVDLALEGFRDLGDDKTMLIARCGEVADAALTQIDAIMAHARTLDAPPAQMTTLDLGRLGDDISTLVDPEGKVDITAPRRIVQADQILMQATLRAVFDTSIQRGATRIVLHDAAPPAAPGLLAFTLSDDGPSLTGAEGAAAMRALGMVRNQLQGRGGALLLLKDGAGLQPRLSLTLPGQPAG